MWVSVLVLGVFAFSAAGCGGNDDEGSSGGDASTETSEPATTDTEAGETSQESGAGGEAATFDDALACLQSEGIDAKDQSSNTSGSTIGIDYGGGRTTISFEETQEDADITASVAESYGEVIQVGTAVASIDPTADTGDTAAVEDCITA
ncbi:MAG: hypothetical protein ACSLFD_08170 [Solirubrobacterales bacterium]